MKITKTQLKQIILEELKVAIKEQNAIDEAGTLKSLASVTAGAFLAFCGAEGCATPTTAGGVTSITSKSDPNKSIEIINIFEGDKIIGDEITIKGAANKAVAENIIIDYYDKRGITVFPNSLIQDFTKPKMPNTFYFKRTVKRNATPSR